MSDWPVGLSTGCFYQKSILDSLQPIRDGGFGMIEVCTFPSHLNCHDLPTVRQAAAMMEDLGIEAYSMHAPFAGHIDITSPDHHQRECAFREIQQAAEAAAILHARYLVIHPGPEDSAHHRCNERLPRLERAAEVLNRVAHHCRSLGVGCVLENKLPHLLFGNTSDILWLMGAMDTVRIGACLDTGHAYLSGDIYKVTHKLSAHLQMIHANDNHGTFDDHLPPGKGQIDWPRLLAELSSTNFHGGIILELAGNCSDQEVLANARKARNYLRGIARQLALSVPPTVPVAPRP